VAGVTRPQVSVIIPTIGRPTLARTLRSIRDQAGPDEVEVLVIGDTHAGTHDLSTVLHTCGEYDAEGYAYDGGEHAWGHPQRNFGARIAEGRYLAYLQDDDVWLPEAWLAIRGSIATGPEGPRLFRVRTWQAGVVWVEAGRLAYGQIDADCIVAPNCPQKLGRWTHVYEGDWHFIRETVAAWGEDRVIWDPTIIAAGRPA
jgi:glycosyltransferase involved in cell wall biosynthesis